MGSNVRQITEKELKIACKELKIQVGLIELIINKVRENQRKSNFCYKLIYEINSEKCLIQCNTCKSIKK